jgi:Orsellinic acid/F9775 biosynthesis cluster protein D
MQLIEHSHQHADIISYLPKYEVVVCTECRYVLNKSPSIGRHLISTHFWSKAEATAVDQQFNDKAI